MAYVKIADKPRTFTYYGSGSDTSQHASKGAYLILACDGEERDANGFAALYGCVRIVAMRQVGHFMMGAARVAGESITVSGSFGSDGLPIGFDPLRVSEKWIDQYGRENWSRTLERDDPRYARVKAKFTRVSDDLAARYWRDPNDGWRYGDYSGIRAIAQAIAEEITREPDASQDGR